MKKSAAFGNEKASMEQALRDDVAIDRINSQAKQSHTPGPWKVDSNLTVFSSNGIIAEPYYGKEDFESQANAHLIAAAPCLLEALRSQRPIVLKMIRVAQDRMDTFLLNEATEALEKLDAAIDKARGQ